MARLGPSERVLYEERHWIPSWILAGAFGVPFALFGGFALLPESRRGGDALSPLASLLFGVGFGLLFAGFFWANHARRVIRVTDRALRIGSRQPILLQEIASVRTVAADDLRSLRRELTRREGAELGVAGLAEPALAELALGSSMIAGRHRRAGMISPPWMRAAALVVTPEARTRVWLVGSRDADRLARALNQARYSAGDDGGPGEERGEGDLQ